MFQTEKWIEEKFRNYLDQVENVYDAIK